MTFNPDKPDPGPSPKIDVSQIQTDFAQWATIWMQNHTAMNNRNQGDHEDIIFELQTSDPGVSTDLDVLYSKNVITAATPSPGKPQLFVQIPKFLPTSSDTSNVPNAPMQLTYNSVNTSGPVYQSFLPGGYILYLGSVTAVGTVTLSPVPTKILMVVATATVMNPAQQTPLGAFGPLVVVPYDVWTNIVTSSTFTINSNLNQKGPVVPYTFLWMAIAIQ